MPTHRQHHQQKSKSLGSVEHSRFTRNAVNAEIAIIAIIRAWQGYDAVNEAASEKA